MKQFLAAGLLLGCTCLPAMAAPEGAPALTVEHAWSRASLGAGRPGVVYLTVIDTGAPDALVGASTPVAESATLHESSNSGGIERMRSVAALPVAAGKELRLAPGGDHLMLMGLRQVLHPGETFPLTLLFKSGAQVETKVSVQAAGATKPMDMPGMTMPDER